MPAGKQVTPRREVRSGAEERAYHEVSLALYQVSRALQAGDLDLALRQARKAVSADPHSAEALAVLGGVQLRRGDAAAAGQAYRRALEMAPGNLEAVNNYGAWLCAQGHAAEALVVFDRVIGDAASHHPGLLANAGSCALRSGQAERAEADLRAALALDPQHPQALQDMARLLADRGELLGARAFYQRRLASAPADASVLQLAIDIEQGLGDAKAVEQYRQRLQQSL